MKKILVLIIVLCCSLHIFSQSHIYKHYTVADGLPSSEVYSAFQDSKGYIWFATDAGVSRFNGYEFENFDVNDGLTDNTIFLITEDNKGKIWFGTFNCQLSYFENDSIYSYEHNKKLAKVLKEKSSMKSFHVDSLENIWMGFYLDGIYKCDKNGKIEQQVDTPEYTDYAFKYFQFKDAFILGTIISDGRQENIKNKIKNFPYQVIGEIQHDENWNITLDKIHNAKDNNFQLNNFQGGYLLTGDPVYFIKKKNGKIKINEITPPFFIDDPIHSTLIDGDFIWYSTVKGVYKCKLINNEVVVINKYLEDKSISTVFKDSENGYWFQSLMDGVYYLSTEEIKYSKATKPITAIEVDTSTGQLYMAYNNGGVVKEKNDSHFETISNQKTASLTLEYDYFNQTLLVGGTSGHFPYYKNDQIKIIKEIRAMQTKSFLVDKDIIYRVNGFGLSIIKNEKEIYYSYHEGVPKMWCTSLMKNRNDVWVGTKEGIRIYRNKKVTNPFLDNKYLSGCITSMDRLNNDIILVGTKNYGLLLIKNDSIIDKISMKDGLLTNGINTIHVDNQQKIWVGSNKGVSMIDYRSPLNYAIHNLTKYHGFVTGEINDVCSYKNTIYASSLLGLYKFDKTKIKSNTNPPFLAITHFNVNLEEKNIEKEINLSYEENNINIDFEALNYRSLGEVEYQYRMLGVDTNWISTNAMSAQYPTLKPNDYKFEVKAKNEDGVWSKQPLTFSFTINPPFWLTWWFNLALVTLLISFIYIGFKVNVLAYNKHIQQEILNRLLRKLGRQSFILIEMDKQHIRINENKILFIEAFKNYVEINTLDKKYLYRSTMNNMVEKLTAINFIRTHRSFIVQKDKIDSISDHQLKVQNHLIPIGKTYQSKLKALKDQFFRLNA